MAHQRQTIRSAVVSLLSTHTSAGTNVYANRKTKLWLGELPAIFIYSLDESAAGRDIRSTQYIRTLQLQIEVHVKATSNVDNDLDDLLLAVEAILSANQTLSATALSALYQTTEIRLDTESEYQIGVGVLTYQVQYIL